MARNRLKPWSPDGFSLVEVLIATFLLAVAATGVARVITLAADANRAAATRTMSTLLAAQKLEQLRSLDWGYEHTSGAWVTVSDRSTNLASDPLADGGTGLSPSSEASLESSVPGFVDYLGADGDWLGTGHQPVAGTVYVRRWSIHVPSQAFPETLVLQVRVTLLRREVVLTGPARPGTLADEIWLVTVLTRKAA